MSLMCRKKDNILKTRLEQDSEPDMYVSGYLEHKISASATPLFGAPKTGL